MIKNLLISCLLLLGLTACEKEVDMAKLPGSDLYGHQIRDAINGGNQGSDWFSDYVNPYAKYKPVAYPSISKVGISDWWKAKYMGADADNSGNCGIGVKGAVVASGTNNEQAASIIEACKGWWEYIPPTGGQYQPMRTSDFLGYNHDAIQPIIVDAGKTIEVNNTNTKTLIINFNFEPDTDIPNNLNVIDMLKVGKYELSRCYITGLLADYKDELIKIAESGDPILDDYGNLNQNHLSFDISRLSEMQSGFEYRIYICLRYIPDAGLEYFLPMPDPFDDNNDYNRFPLKLKIIRDAEAGGGGVTDPATQTKFLPGIGSEWKYANECIYEYISSGNGYSMYNYTGELIIGILLTNKSSSSSTYKLNDFKIQNGNDTSEYAQNMYDADPNTGIGGVGSITVPANGSKWFYLKFNQILNSETSTNINNTVELTLYKNSYPIFNGELYYRKSSGGKGWTKR